MKVFVRRGPASYKEKKLIQQLEAAIEKKIAQDPEFAKTFKPATNIDELKHLHSTYCVDDAEIISETKNADMANTASTDGDNTTKSTTTDDINKATVDSKGSNSMSTGSDTNEKVVFDNPDWGNKDPMNRSNPKVRDYVMNDSMNPEDDGKDKTGTTNIQEPTNATSAFKLPSAEEEVRGTADKGPKTPKAPKEPFNPGFNDMGNATRNKKTKRMAKYIVGAFCALLENGVPYLATRDITPIALANAAKRKEINLGIILELDQGTQLSIAEFFAMMREQAKELGKIPKEKQDDLIEDLYDLLIEKGVTPSPMQSIMMSLLEVAAVVGLKTLNFREQIKQVKQIGNPKNQEEQEMREETTPTENKPQVETVNPEPMEEPQEEEYPQEESQNNDHLDDETPDLSSSEDGHIQGVKNLMSGPIEIK